MPELKAPPLPAWHGTPPNLIQLFVEFVRKGSRRRLENLITEIREEIQETEYRKQDNARYLRGYRQTIKQLREQLVSLRASLVPLDDLSRFDESLLLLLDHPAVIGIRPDSGGRLVLHLRLHQEAPEGEQPLYLGDFEVSLAVQPTGYDDDPDRLTITQTNVRSNQGHWAHGFRFSPASDGILHGTLTLPAMSLCPHLVEGTLTELVDLIVKKIETTGRPWEMTGDEPGAPTWATIASDLEGMLARTIDVSANGLTLQRIKSNEASLASYERDAKQSADAIRSAGRKLAQLRSQLQDAEQAYEQQNFDEEEAKAQLHYITSLDGVMGVRFESYHGESVPVIHVRTSIVYDDDRYDMGDYELVFTEYDSCSRPEAVIRVNQTRAPKRGGGLYYHPAGGYGHYGRYNWFCFGNRASDLRKLFRKGEFAEFVHMALHSLNSVNQGYEYDIPHFFNPIPMDATWTPPVRASRPRRRRLAKVLGGMLV